MVIGTEVCDDGTNDNVGCATGCLSVNPLYICPTAGGPTTASVCSLKCGNNVLDAGETCDDGDVSDASECNSTCTGNVAGWSCTGGSPSTNSTCVAALCGDSMVIGHRSLR
jgi:cysteine-rich repeat protein